MFNMMHAFVGPASSKARMTAITAIKYCGLSANLQLVLDAGDENSYSSGQKWLDVSGNGYDFFRGTSSSAEGSDPTFNGTAGNASDSEYWSGDGGDYFTYDTTEETWMQNLHKPGVAFTIQGHARIPSDVDVTLIATRGGQVGEYGMEVAYEAVDNRMRYLYVDSADTLAAIGSAAPGLSTVPALVQFAFATDLTINTIYTVQVDGISYTTNIVPISGSSNNGAGVNMRIMALGDVSAIAPSGTRIYDVEIWSRRLSEDELAGYYNTVRGKFGT